MIFIDNRDKPHKFKNKYYVNEKNNATNIKNRRAAVYRVARDKTPKCSNPTCGCTVYALLEINHKYGGGKKEFDAINGNMEFYRRIACGERDIDDLELLCKVCNNEHHVSENLGFKGFYVTYVGEEHYVQVPQLIKILMGEDTMNLSIQKVKYRTREKHLGQRRLDDWY